MERIDDDVLRAALRRQARRVWVKSIALAAALTAFVLLVPA